MAINSEAYACNEYYTLCVISSRNGGRVYQTIFAGYGAESHSDAAFNEVIKSEYALAAFTLDGNGDIRRNSNNEVVKSND